MPSRGSQGGYQYTARGTPVAAALKVSFARIPIVPSAPVYCFTYVPVPLLPVFPPLWGAIRMHVFLLSQVSVVPYRKRIGPCYTRDNSPW